MQNSNKKRAPIICAIIISLLALSYIGLLLYILLVVGLAPLTIVILVVYGAALVAIIIGVFAALRQRLKEIDSGEEEEAKKY